MLVSSKYISRVDSGLTDLEPSQNRDRCRHRESGSELRETIFSWGGVELALECADALLRHWFRADWLAL